MIGDGDQDEMLGSQSGKVVSASFLQRVGNEKLGRVRALCALKDLVVDTQMIK